MPHRFSCRFLNLFTELVYRYLVPVLRMNETDPDPRIHTLTNESGCGSGSCYFRQWPSRCKKNYFFCFYFLKVYIIFQITKKSQKSRNQCFSYNFCLMIERFGSGPLIYGSGSGMPKNIVYYGSGSATLDPQHCPVSGIFMFSENRT